MKMEKLLSISCLLAGIAAGQLLDPALLTKPLGDAWPTYSGDYSGKRYSSLTQINESNVKNLTLAWVSKFTGGEGTADMSGGGGFGGGTNIRASILMVNGILYFSTPDNAWAADARDGHE